MRVQMICNELHRDLRFVGIGLQHAANSGCIELTLPGQCPGKSVKRYISQKLVEFAE